MFTKSNSQLPTWLILIFPILILIGLIFLFLNTNPIQVSSRNLPPVENISIQRITLPESGLIELEIINGGPDDVTISQVIVDDAYWSFTIEPDNTLSSLETAIVSIPYPWIQTEAHEIVLITNSGATFDAEIELAIKTPPFTISQALAYALVGVYVGIIPVGLGMLWYPAMRRFSYKAMNFVLSITIGLLLFLLVDTYLEMAEVAEQLPAVYQGLPLGLFVALLTWLLIMAIGNSKQFVERDTEKGRGFIAFIIALGIGFHNLGEGLVVGAAFAIGEVSLGSFLVVGFILHNLTEGIGIISPLTKDNPPIRRFILLLLIAGAPAIVGTLIGGFAYSPLLTVIFLGVGVGAILQVIVEVSGLLKGAALKHESDFVSWLNVSGLLAGILIMYATAFLVKF